jgi:hypothetical protein
MLRPHSKVYRKAVEKATGRRLKPIEVVHHKNENPWDNRLENLEVMSMGEHLRLHARMRKVAWAHKAFLQEMQGNTPHDIFWTALGKLDLTELT